MTLILSESCGTLIHQWNVDSDTSGPSRVSRIVWFTVARVLVGADPQPLWYLLIKSVGRPAAEQTGGTCAETDPLFVPSSSKHRPEAAAKFRDFGEEKRVDDGY